MYLLSCWLLERPSLQYLWIVIEKPADVTLTCDSFLLKVNHVIDLFTLLPVNPQSSVTGEAQGGTAQKSIESWRDALTPGRSKGGLPSWKRMPGDRHLANGL